MSVWSCFHQPSNTQPCLALCVFLFKDTSHTHTHTHTHTQLIHYIELTADSTTTHPWKKLISCTTFLHRPQEQQLACQPYPGEPSQRVKSPTGSSKMWVTWQLTDCEKQTCLQPEQKQQAGASLLGPQLGMYVLTDTFSTVLCPSANNWENTPSIFWL